MDNRERDPMTGYLTTGHEWDGIKELNTPIPHWWVSAFIICCMVAVVYMYLYPSFATTKGYFRGVLDWTSKGELSQELEVAAAGQASWRLRIASTPLEQITADPDLRRFAIAGGRAVFNENCAPCHGVGAGGQQGQFPSLIDDDWLWGGKVGDIYQTIRHGVRNDDPDSRASAMPAFGDSLKPQEIDQLADFLLNLSSPRKTAIEAEAPGAKLYAENCAGCHGEQAEGNREVGAPKLNDAIWLYGYSKEAIQRQIARPRQGVMPSFQTRMPDETIRMLAAYIHSLGGGEQ